MQLIGDPEGVASLRELAAQSRDFLKFLITEAQTASDHAAAFTGGDGTRWILRLRPGTGELDVQRAPSDPPRP